MITKLEAILSLVPGAAITQHGNSVEWHSPSIATVTDEQIATEQARLQASYEAMQYKRDRQPEYPPITDYLDGVVKGDQAQIDKYIADCQAVKAKYPKGS